MKDRLQEGERRATDLGNAVGSFAANGTITITITTDQADNVATGQDLSAIEVRTFDARTLSPEGRLRFVVEP